MFSRLFIYPWNTVSIFWKKLNKPDRTVLYFTPFDELKLFSAIEMAYYRFDLERELRASEIHYRTSFETMLEGVIYRDGEEKVIAVNPAAQRILGMSAKKLTEDGWIDAQYDAYREDGSVFPRVDFPSHVAFTTGKPVHNVVMRVYNPQLGEYRWVRTNSVPWIRPGEERPYQIYTTMEDITELKQYEKELIEDRRLLVQRVEERTADLSIANAQLAKASRMKDEFLASMSHELRTPLTGILGLAETLQNKSYGDLSERQLFYVKTIEESGKHLLSLINDILDISKIEAGKLDLTFTPVDLGAICQAGIRFVRQDIQRKRLIISTNFDAEVGVMIADERRLIQIVVNLLSNAIKFTPEDGYIGVETALDIEQQWASITVWDNGIGIRKEDLRLLFMPFVQLDSSLSRQYSGSGLGLSLILRLTELHGGGIIVKSEKGKGSRFQICLPLRESNAAGQPTLKSENLNQKKATNSRPNDTGKPVVMVVEDNNVAMTRITNELLTHGYLVYMAWNGAEAIEKLREVRPDILIMDTFMPVMNGLEAVKRLRAEPEIGRIPVIAVSSLVIEGDQERCREAGMDEYLIKPIAKGRLIEVIEKIRQQARRSS